MNARASRILLCVTVCAAFALWVGADGDDPPRIEATITSTPLPDGKLRLIISYSAQSNFNYVVEYRDRLGELLSCSPWNQLPGAPHNLGEVWDNLGQSKASPVRDERMPASVRGHPSSRAHVIAPLFRPSGAWPLPTLGSAAPVGSEALRACLRSGFKGTRAVRQNVSEPLCRSARK